MGFQERWAEADQWVLDVGSESYTRANVACSRATDLTVLACPVNMFGIPGVLQVLYVYALPA